MITRILKVAAINVLLVVVVAVLAELFFGTWFSDDPLDRLSLQRDYQIVIPAQDVYSGGKDFEFRRDHWGFRGVDADPAQIDVVTLGGSTTNQLYLPDDLTWQGVAMRELAAMGRQAVIANAGLDGQSTMGHIRALEEWLPNVPGLKPRFVLAYVGINDVHVGNPSIDALRHSSRTKWIRANSALYRLATTVAGAISAREARLNHQSVDPASIRWVDQPNYPDGWKVDQPHSVPPLFKERLKTMAGLIHRMGAVPVFITQARGDFRIRNGRVEGWAAEDGPNGIDQYRRLEQFNDATRALCVEEGYLCLDLAREVKFEPGDFYDAMHNTPQGAEKIGRWLAGKLAGLV